MPQLLALPLILAIQGMMVPEAVYYDAKTGHAYVSNIVGEGWAKDNDGFITRLAPDGSVETLKWRTRTADGPLSAPKGMCVLDGHLYCADIDLIHRFSLKTDSSESIPIPGARRLNDLATDGKAVFASDTALGALFRLDKDTRKTTRLPGVPSINGITCHNSKMYGVSWDLHEIYELDPSGEADPAPFGLAENFTNLDGIEVLPNGIVIVSDFKGNKVSLVSPDHVHALTLLEVKTPADIAVDLKGHRLFVPEFQGGQVSIYSLATLFAMSGEGETPAPLEP